MTPETIERITGAPVQNFALYKQALTHRSLVRGRPDSHLATNERLEFLGDALLGFVVAEALYEHFPEKDEGFLTRLRAKLVSGKALTRYARRLNLGRHILMSENAERGEGRDNPSILSDAFEALIGALYLDHGLEVTRQFIHTVALAPIDLAELAAQNENYKSQLLEYMQAQRRSQPTYRVIREEGPSHNKTFTVEALVDGEPHGRGSAGSKKKAEQQAARKTLEQLEAEAEKE